jgi:hypothetical protein
MVREALEAEYRNGGLSFKGYGIRTREIVTGFARDCTLNHEEP